MWPLPTGILLERRKHISPSQLSSHVPLIDQDDNAPSLFRILHPLEEARALYFFNLESKCSYFGVPYKPSMENEDEDLSIRDPHLRVVYSSSDIPLLILFNNDLKKHTIWLIRIEKEDGGESDLFLEHLETLDIPYMASNVFLLAKDHSDIILSVMISEEMKLYFYELSFREADSKESSLSILPLGRISCLLAVPVNILDPISIKIITRKVRLSSYLVVQEKNENLALYAIDQKITNLNLPRLEGLPEMKVSTPITPLNSHIRNIAEMNQWTPLKNNVAVMSPFSPMSPSSPFTSDVDYFDDRLAPLDTSNLTIRTPKPKGSIKPSIKDLMQPIGNRFNIKFHDNSEYRVALDLKPKSPLLWDCVRAIKCSIPTNIFHVFLSDFIAFQSINSTTIIDEWDLFNEYMKHLLNGALNISTDNEKEETSSDEDEDWKFLLSSDYHHSHKDTLPLINDTQIDLKSRTYKNTKYTSSSVHMHEYIPHIIQGLHLLYENMQLNILTSNLMHPLVHLLSQLVLTLNWKSYYKYYTRDQDQDVMEIVDEVKIQPLYNDPPDIYSWIEDCLNGTRQSFPLLRGTNNPCERIRSICRFYHLLKFGTEYVNDDLINFEPIENIPMAITVEMVKSPRTSPIKANKSKSNLWRDRAKLTVAALTEEFIDINDLDTIPFGIALPLREAIYEVRKHPPHDWPPRCYYFVGRYDLAQQLLPFSTLTSRKDVVDKPKEELEKKKVDQEDLPETTSFHGTEIRNYGSLMRFSQDDRLEDVSHFLRSTDPVLFRSEDLNKGEEDLTEVLQKALIQLLQRPLALSIGRGMFTLFADFDYLDETDNQGKELTSLGKIMNIEQLRIPRLNLSGRVPDTNSMIPLDLNKVSTELLVWPEFHNGVAAGLRLTPADLDTITPAWISYNRPKDSKTSDEHAGLLMAIGLLGHLKSLPMEYIYDYFSISHQTTSIGLLIGVAASSLGSCDENLSKVICLHHQALNYKSDDLIVPPLVQSAAMVSLGLLYYGSMDRDICEMLLKEITAKRSPVDLREGYSLSAGIALGLICLGKDPNEGSLSNMNLSKHLVSLMNGTMENDNVEPLKYLTFETQYNNIDVTASSAILALTLIYMKSHNSIVARQLALPETPYLLDYVRPDHMIMRVLGENLILWNDIEPTEEWIQTRYPELVRNYGDGLMANMRVVATTKDDDVSLVLRQAYLTMTSGLHLAIGIRYAGSHLNSVANFLLEGVYKLLKLQKHLQYSSDRAILEMCILVSLMSASIVMSGSGNLDIYKVIRQLRKRGREETLYGYHMALSMCTGLLFLGGGRCTISTSNLAIATLLCSIYPIFPPNCLDNRYHLQALRHLYVLGVEPRFFETKDVETLLPCFVPIKIKLKETPLTKIQGDNLVLKTTAPCVLPPYDWIDSIEIDSIRYWYSSLQPTKNNLHEDIVTKKRYLLVQRKQGYLSYSQDPNMDQSVTIRRQPRMYISSVPNSKQEDFVSLIQSFTNDPNLLSFAEYFCKNSLNTPKDLISEMSPKILLECITQDKTEILSLYLLLNQMLSTHNKATSRDLKNVRVLVNFYETGVQKDTDDQPVETLIFPDYILQLKLKFYYSMK